MVLKRIKLLNFRNYKSQEVVFHPRSNIIVGGNAQGKSNLIESIYYLSHLRSKRTSVNNHLVMNGEDYMVIEGEVFDGTQKARIKVEMTQNGRNLEINGRKNDSRGTLGLLMRTVLFYPEDLLIIKEGPSLRRDYLDETVEEVKPGYEEKVNRYRHIVKQRNAILKEWERQGSRLKEVLLPWDEAMVELGAVIISERMTVIDSIKKNIKEYYRLIAGSEEEIGIEYQPTCDVKEPLTENIRTALAESGEEEKRLRTTVVGPHRDGVEINIRGLNTRFYASQGEQRTIGLCMRLSQRDYIVEETGNRPILLLDDVLSELDSERRKRVIDCAGEGGQLFITATEPAENISGANAFFEARNGEIIIART